MSGWADQYVEWLASGQTIQFRPRGHSMTGKVNHKQLVTVTPVIEGHILVRGDVVLCTVADNQYLHLIKDIKSVGPNLNEYLIGNNKGRINGWVGRGKIHGRLIKVED